MYIHIDVYVFFSVLRLEDREGLEHTRQTLTADTSHQLIAAFLLVISGSLVLISMVTKQVYIPTSSVYASSPVVIVSVTAVLTGVGAGILV